MKSNPLISRLKQKLEISLYECKNTTIKSYVQSILLSSAEDVAKKYGLGIETPLKKINLPEEWSLLRQYLNIAGIYLFVNGKDSYLGSSKDLFRRCFIEHKNKSITSTSKHRKFYNNVVTNSWNLFTLYILELTPNHLELFVKLNPNYVLNFDEYLILILLNLYELTIAEQVYIDTIKPTLNGSLYANWSSYNKGSTGYIKSKTSNDKLSMSFLNRTFDDSTIELHRKNRTGKFLSVETRQKIALSNKGKSVILVDINANKEIQFDSILSLSRELLISARTINRWALDKKIHKTKSLKYPLIQIKL